MKSLLAATALLIAAPLSAEPLIFDNGRLFIQARINGMPAEALLDSAAEATLVDPQLAKVAKLGEGQEIDIRGSGGVAKARIVEGVSLEAIDIKVTPEAVVITDLSELSSRLIKRSTVLVMGRELFDAARLQIDIAKGTIAQVPASEVPPGKLLILTPHAGVESLPVTVNGLQAQAEFDLGNGSEVLISRAMANRLGLKVAGTKTGGGIGGQVNRDLVVLKRLDVAGQSFQDVPAAIDDQPSANDLNVGTSILKSFLITTDFKQRSIWLQPVKAPN